MRELGKPVSNSVIVGEELNCLEAFGGFPLPCLTQYYKLLTQLPEEEVIASIAIVSLLFDHLTVP